MAWSNPFHRRTPNTRTCWGYTFELTDDHMTEAETEPMKQSYDMLGEEAYVELKELASKLSVRPAEKDGTESLSEQALSDGLPPSTAGPTPSKDEPNHDQPATPSPDPNDLFAVLEAEHASSETLSRLWDEIHNVPSWVSWPQIERGQRVFYRYGGAAFTGLAYQSLLGGLGGGRVVETLARTGGFNVKVARRRLWETTQFILQVTQSLESLRPGGAGLASCVRVRLLHAAVRRRIMALARARPEYYRVAEWGVPINDLDSVATITTFCASLVWISWPRQGIFLRRAETEDFVALWRYIAHLMGAPTDPFATTARARQTMEILLLREVCPTQTSRILANNMVRALQGAPPTFHSADMLAAMARWLNGNELADALGLPQPSIYYRMLVAGQCVFFMAISYTYRSVPYLDERKIETLRRILWKITVDAKYSLQGKASVFEFKYVPQFETVTELGDAISVEEIRGGLEVRNLIMFGLGLGIVSTALWGGYMVVRRAVRLVW